MKIYIAGPVTGHEDGNRMAFYRAEKALQEAGYETINPRENGDEGERTWLDYMRISLRQIADCDGICFLEGWDRSRGATIEVGLGDELGLPVRSLQHWTA